MAAITQRSQRYCDESPLWKVTPHEVSADEESLLEYNKVMVAIEDAYTDLHMLHNVPKEDARYVLPNACATELYFSCNLRELIHIANERLCVKAQWEIRELVQEMCDQVDPDLHWMLVPKCASGIYICYNDSKCIGHKSPIVM